MKYSSSKKTTPKVGFALPTILLLMALAGLAYPLASDWYSSYKADQTIQMMKGAYEPMDDPERLALKANAQAYNAHLGGYDYDDPDYSGELLDYSEQLIFKGIPQMAWLNIPSIDVRVPVYHGTSEGTLMVGAGHLEGTSLPVGGQSSLCVITGHSGMRAERMFDDIRKLENGDVFVLHTLDEPYAYKVCDIKTVLPEEADALKLQPGRDLCVLVTCTPYGINSHRLLVFGERCPYDAEQEPESPPLSVYINSRTELLLIGLGAVTAVGVVIFGMYRITKRKKRSKAC